MVGGGTHSECQFKVGIDEDDYDYDDSENETPIYRRARRERQYDGSIVASSDDESDHTSANSSFDFNPEREDSRPPGTRSRESTEATSDHSQETETSIFSTESEVGKPGRGPYHYNHPAHKELRANYRELRNLGEDHRPPLGPLIVELSRRFKKNERDLRRS